MGIKKDESPEEKAAREEAEREATGGEFDYKESAGFAKHMKVPAQPDKAPAPHLPRRTFS